MRPVLLLQLGEAPEPVRLIHGPFATWFERAWGGPLRAHDGRAGAPLPDPRGLAGLVLTGSAWSLTRPEPWMADAAELIVACHTHGVPVLGVCFGHQLIAAAFGGVVVAHPRGWEIGTVSVEIDSQDPLFSGLSPRIRVNMVHEDVVARDTPSSVRVIGQNAHTRIAALAVGEHVRGVQFHPEVTGAIVRSYIDARRPRLGALDPDALIAAAGDCPDAVRVLQNFRQSFVEKS